MLASSSISLVLRLSSMAFRSIFKHPYPPLTPDPHLMEITYVHLEGSFYASERRKKYMHMAYIGNTLNRRSYI